MAGSYGRCTFNFLRNCKTGSYISLPTFGVVSLLDLAIQSAMVSNSGFNLLLLND